MLLIIIPERSDISYGPPQHQGGFGGSISNRPTLRTTMKSLPNGRQQGGAFGAAPKGVLVFHLVRISNVFGVFPDPFWTSTGPPVAREIW